MGISVEPPDVQVSGRSSRRMERRSGLALAAVKNVGGNAIESI